MINGEMYYKKSEPHKASVTGDTVGDPFKDTSGPSMNILIKLMSIVSLVIAPYIAVNGNAGGEGKCEMDKAACCAEMGKGKCEMSKCDMSQCANMSKEECAKMCDEKGCTPEEKAYCMSMYGADGKFVGPKCDMNKCMNMSKEECAAYCDSMKCSPEEKAMCLQHAGKESKSECMQGCNMGCKSKAECSKSCGDACANSHKN